MQGPYDFGWRLSGEPAVAPLQVFSSAQGVWLQFTANQDRPAIFGATPGSAPALLRQTDMAPYVFVPGAWSRLIFQAGARQAFATRLTPSVPAPATTLADRSEARTATTARFSVSRQDINMRRALTRWASAAGWTFESEHWVADSDVPISAQAALGHDFRDAVRHLLASTEMSDLPLQPCFYSNRVLRVIGYAQSCDPRRAAYTASATQEVAP